MFGIVGLIVRTVISRLLLIIFLLIIAIPLVICLLLPQQWLVDNWLFTKITQIFYWVVIKCSFLPITYVGLTNIPTEPSLIVSNHQSSFDIPLIGYALDGHPHAWLALADLTKSPLLRFILPRVAVLVDTSSPGKGMRTLIQAINLISTKPWHMIIFPEGGRYTDGSIHPFMAGFAAIARKTGRPVVPIKIVGANKVYPPNSFLVRWHPILVVVGETMHMQEGETDEAFTQRVYTWFVQTAIE